LDADHPSTGVTIARRSTRRRQALLEELDDELFESDPDDNED
jgi:hypothetical protein